MMSTIKKKIDETRQDFLNVYTVASEQGIS